MACPLPPSLFHRFNASPEVIRLVVMMYVRYPLSLRNVANIRLENSQQPFRRRERAMARFRRMHTLQTFSSVHASFHNHFNGERHLTSRDQFRERRSAALAEWRTLAA